MSTVVGTIFLNNSYDC